MTHMHGTRAYLKAHGVQVDHDPLATDFLSAISPQMPKRWQRWPVTVLVMSLALLGLLAFASACVGPTTPSPVVTLTPAPLLVAPALGLVDPAQATINWIVGGIFAALLLIGLIRVWVSRP